jgi:chorismate mutase
MNLNMDGLMIETHINPDKALSDAKQQVTPLQLFNIINQLQIRKATSQDIIFKTKLEKLRNSLDKIDNDLLYLLAERMKLSEEIGY